MKTLIFTTLIIFIFFSTATAQNQSRNWVFSDTLGLKFNTDGTISQYKSSMNGIQRHGCAVMSDKNGDLLFYAGGHGIEYSPSYNPNDLSFFNRNHAPLFNSNGVNTTNAFYTLQQILPMDTLGRYYYLIHMELDQTTFARHMAMYWSEIDLTLDNGLGGFTQHKRKIINSPVDTFIQGMLAVRHANGRDWWMLTHDFGNDTFDVIYIGLGGNVKIQKQRIGSVHGLDAPLLNGGNIGFWRYDPVNSKIIVSNAQNLFEIFDFNRCTGVLSNPISVHSPILTSTSGEWFLWSEISSNGRYYYVLSSDNVQNNFLVSQFDLQSSNILNSRQILFMSTPQQAGGCTHINRAPNGKIYLGCLSDYYDTTNVNNANYYYLSAIENPDLPYPACNFNPRALWLNGQTYYSGIPELPDYDLGPVDGSLCDTLGLNVSVRDVPSEPEFGVFPNPAQTHIQIQFPSNVQIAEFKIYSATGIQVFEGSVTSESVIYLPDEISSGLYYIYLSSDKYQGSYRVSVQR